MTMNFDPTTVKRRQHRFGARWWSFALLAVLLMSLFFLAGAQAAKCPNIVLPTLTGQNTAQKIHDYLCWEINGWTAMRQGQWRAVKPDKAETWELYDLASDPSESKDLASAAARRHKPAACTAR